MSDFGLEHRKRLTFEQAEGVAPLPSQLALKEVTPQLRAALWRVLYSHITDELTNTRYDPKINDRWAKILQSLYVLRHASMVDEFSWYLEDHIKILKPIFETGKYTDIFGLLQWILRENGCPHTLPQELEKALVFCGAAYRVIDKDTIAPVGSAEEARAITAAVADLSSAPFAGAKSHLKAAAQHCSARNFADSVRESIHAVEAVARVLSPTKKLSDALEALEKSSTIHSAMKRGFLALYGWTSDEQGIRHPLLEAGDTNVTEQDALFMIGACSAFISYLVGRARTAALVQG